MTIKTGPLAAPRTPAETLPSSKRFTVPSPPLPTTMRDGALPSSAAARMTLGGSVLVFQDAAAAEAFRILEGLGPEWEVLEEDNREAIDLLLTCAAGGAKYIALNPPSALARGHEEHPLIPTRAFADGLMEG